MKRTKTGLLLAGVLCLALSVQTSCIQQTPWEKANAAGTQAFQQGRYGEAVRQFKAALIEAENFGEQDPRLATSLNNLAELYQAQGKYTEAEPLYQRALAIYEKGLGPDHPYLAASLENYAALLRKMKRDAEAAEMEARAKAIRAKQAQENPPN